MERIVTILIAPLATLLLLGGIVANNRTHVKPKDAAPFHHRAKALIDSIPKNIGTWTGSDTPLEPAALALLQPNAYLQRRYMDMSNARYFREVQLLVVQCDDTRHILGHYPPVCYPNNGWEQTAEMPRNWKLSDTQTLRGMEYHFSRSGNIGRTTMTVYNFLVVPSVGVVRDMAPVDQAAADFQLRYFGAAQFQFIMDGHLSQPERDEIFKTLMTTEVNGVSIAQVVQGLSKRH